MLSVSSLLVSHLALNTSLRLPIISGKPAVYVTRRLPMRPFTRSLSMVSMQGPDDPHPSEWNWLLPEPPQVPSGLSLLEREQLVALYQKARQQRALGELLKCDLIEDIDKFAVTANLPGLVEDDINIEIDMESRALMISASMLQEYNHEEGIEGTFHIRERTAGTLQRSFRLPKTADLESAHSSFQDGILCIVIPKLQAKTTAAAKKNSVTSKSVTSIPIATPLEHEENKRKKLIRDLKGKFKSNK